MKKHLNTVRNSQSLSTLNSLSNNPGARISSSSSQSSSFVNSSGAGSTSSATATSPTGSSSSSQTTYTAGATSSSGSAQASASSSAPPTSSVTATAPAGTPAPPEVTNIEDESLKLTVTQDSNGGQNWQGSPDSDVIDCGGGFDQVFAGDGGDTVTGNRGSDVIDGGDGNDSLQGGKGLDLLIGRNGDDFLCGDFGADTLIGGNGADRFVFRPETATPVANLAYADIVQDFNAAQGDKIGLTAGISIAEIALQVFDTNGDGQADATLVKFSSNNGDRILAVVLGTVNAAGLTTLTNADLISLPNNSF